MAKKEGTKDKDFNVTDIPEMPKDIDGVNWEGLSAIVKMANPDSKTDIKKSIDEFTDITRHAIASAKHYKDKYEDLSKMGKIEPVAIDHEANIIKLSWFDRLSTDIALNRTIAIRGPAGNGKSTGAVFVLKSKGFNVYHMDCTDSTTVDMLVGGIVPVPDGKGGISMEFRDGLIARAFKDDKAAVVLDEYDALDPRVAMCLQSFLQRDSGGAGKRKVSAPDHPNGHLISKNSCPVIVTMNTYGTGATREYVGRNAGDAANMDRFDTFIDTNYENEIQILEAKFGKDAVKKHKGEIDKVIAWAEKVRGKIQEKSLRIILSTRRLIDITEAIIVLGIDPTNAVSREFKGRLSPPELAALSGDDKK